MEEIAENIFIEQNLSGVTIGAFKFPDGLLFVDAPWRRADVRAWLTALAASDGRIRKMLVMLDTHIDRTIGIQGLEATVIAHENAVNIIDSRNPSLRMQDLSTTAAFTPNEIPSNIQWVTPDMTYSESICLYLNGNPLQIYYRPGSHIAGSWLRYEAEKVLFIGDSVVTQEPPFLGWANMGIWLKELEELMADASRGYTIISGRDGQINQNAIEKMMDILIETSTLINPAIEKEDLADIVSETATTLINHYGFNWNSVEDYRKRLVWGLENYLWRCSKGQLTQELHGGVE